MKPFYFHRGLLCCLPLLILFSITSNAAAQSIVEEFTTTQYRDPLNTTAWWDTITGELKLHPFQPTLLGSYDTPGAAMDVALAGNYVYLADDWAGFQIYDISDPTSPFLTGSYAMRARAVVLEGRQVYLADPDYGLRIIDISDPSAPSQVGSYNSPNAFGLAVSGNFVYLANFTAGLTVINITNLASPSLAGSYNTPNQALDVKIRGDYAYVADQDGGLQIVDISNPASPVLAGSYDTPNWTYGVELAGNYAYLADYQGGLQVIDISNPASPVSVGNYATSGAAWDVEVAGDYAYLTDNWGPYVMVLDITDPPNPVEIGTFDMMNTDYARGLAIDGGRAVLANGDNGLKIFRIASNARPPILAESHGGTERAWAVSVDGDYAYLSTRTPPGLGLHILDISDPLTPVQVGYYGMTPASHIKIVGDLAYMAVEGIGSGLYIVDVSDPANPSLTSYYGSMDSMEDLDVAGDFTFVTAHNGMLRVFNTSNPASPALVTSVVLGNSGSGVDVEGDYLYVSADWAGLLVFNITNPASPALVGSQTSYYRANDVAVVGNYAFIADQTAGFAVMDIRDPTAPVLVGGYNTPSDAREVFIRGNRAYVADTGGLQVIDISDPTSPVPAGSFITGGAVNDVFVEGDYAFVTDYYNCLQILQVYDRSMDLNNNTAQSIAYTAAGTIDSLILSATQSDSILWEVSTNNGQAWQVMANDVWEDVPGDSATVMWRATLTCVEPGVYPTCSALQFEVDLQVAVLISNFTAVDQNDGVRLEWSISADEAIEGFNIYRQTQSGGLGTQLNQPGLISPADRSYLDADIQNGRSYWYTLTAVKVDGSEVVSRTTRIHTRALSLALYQNHPNPFNPSTTISYSLPGSLPVNLTIYNLEGKRVVTLVDGNQTGGFKELIWNGRDSAGQPVSSGIYLYRLKAGKNVITRKMVMIR
jgi:hypothetical protein